MFQSLLNAWRLPDLRKRLLFTAFIIALYRLGSFIPVPGVDLQAIKDLVSGGGVFAFLDLFSGGALERVAVFALGIMPYITASIILQLLTIVIPQLEALAKEGESGAKKINQYTRYLTIILALVQSVGYVFIFQSQGAFTAANPLTPLRFYLIVLSLTVGTGMVMWLGELITQRGVGNGISLIIFSSIVASLPGGLYKMFTTMNPLMWLALALIGLGVIAAIVLMQEGQRRIPIQYAKRVVGRKMYGGQSTYLPLRINMAGVIPVIFASAILVFPVTLAQMTPWSWAQTAAQAVGPGTGAYLVAEFMLIVLFTYFYTAVQFNPLDQADNLKKYGGFIPGIRPGRPTAQYLDRVLTRITLPGALFLASIAALPTLLIWGLGIPFFFGGTSLLIVVGVALDTMKQMESQLLMRHYEGFLK
ncbi:MAG: preprotein translocase subunit SecY [Actinobacteria bacterium]|nr:preprotein translocase subunit SecY [Actinomycetota bacterium]